MTTWLQSKVPSVFLYQRASYCSSFSAVVTQWRKYKNLYASKAKFIYLTRETFLTCQSEMTSRSTKSQKKKIRTADRSQSDIRQDYGRRSFLADVKQIVVIHVTGHLSWLHSFRVDASATFHRGRTRKELSCVGIDHAAACRRCHRKEDRTFNQEAAFARGPHGDFPLVGMCN